MGVVCVEWAGEGSGVMGVVCVEWAGEGNGVMGVLCVEWVGVGMLSLQSTNCIKLRT